LEITRSISAKEEIKYICVCVCVTVCVCVCVHNTQEARWVEEKGEAAPVVADIYKERGNKVL